MTHPSDSLAPKSPRPSPSPGPSPATGPEPGPSATPSPSPSANPSPHARPSAHPSPNTNAKPSPRPSPSAAPGGSAPRHAHRRAHSRADGRTEGHAEGRAESRARGHEAAASPGGLRPATPRATRRPRLIATDLDGTLLRSDKTVSPRTVAALAAAEDAGIEVFFVTGRPARWMGVVSEHVHGHGLAICANGAAVVDLHAESPRIVRVRELARADALAVVHALREAAPGVTFAVERAGGIHYEPDYPFFPHDPGTSYAPADELLAEGTGPASGRNGTGSGSGTGAGTGTGTGTGPGAAPGAGADPVLKLLAHHPGMDPDDFLALGRKTAGTHAEFTRSSPSALLEISGLGVSKASTLALACAERGIAPEEVVAFGDMPNDLAMLAWAGTSYAMANGHPDVRVSTTHTTSTNEEDGVATVIETYVR